MLVLEQDDGTGRLAVEGAGHVQQRLLDELGDTRVGHGRVGVEGVVAAARLDGVHESVRRHVGSGVEGAVLGMWWWGVEGGGCC